MSKVSLSKEVLEPLVNQGLTYEGLCRETGYSRSHIIRMLKAYGLKTDYARKCKSDGSCRVCGSKDIPAYSNRRLCVVHLKATVNLEGFLKRRSEKQKIVDHLGGKCSNCGFDKSLFALDIHHLDPTQKDPLFHRILFWKWARIVEELKNCVLLCANCHRIEHYEH